MKMFDQCNSPMEAAKKTDNFQHANFWNIWTLLTFQWPNFNITCCYLFRIKQYNNDDMKKIQYICPSLVIDYKHVLCVSCQLNCFVVIMAWSHGVTWYIMVSCGLCKECCNNDCHVPAPGGCGLDTRGRKEGQRRNWCWHAPVAPVGARVWSRSRHQLDKWHNYADTGPVVATVAAGGRCLVTCGAWTWSCHDHVISPSNTSHNHKLSHLHL